MRFFLDKNEVDLILTYLREENIKEVIHTRGYNTMFGPVQKSRANKLVQKILKTVKFETIK